MNQVVPRKTEAVIIDIDGVLANPSKRLHHLDKPDFDWDDFFADMGADDVNEWATTLAFSFHLVRSLKILLVTGRPERYRGETERWLKTHVIPYDVLLMRPNDDMRSGPESKLEIYARHIEPFYNVTMALDDSASICQMWHSLGIPALLIWHDPKGS